MAKNKTFLIGVTVVSAVVTFLLSPVIWPNYPDMMIVPGAAQLPYLMAVAAIESIAFGVGVAFLLSLWGSMHGRGTWDWLTYLSVVWLLVSWWPHDNLHRTMMMGDYWQLVRIEWGFHVTLIAAGVIVASFVWKRFGMQGMTQPNTSV